MKNILAFTMRNAKIFLRDKATFFFSLMSSLILMMLYFLFIGKAYIDGIMENTDFITKEASGFIVYLQMMAGVLVLNSMSLSLGMFSGMAKDFESHKFSSFLTTPVKKNQLLISYYCGGVILSFALNLFTWLLTVLLIGVLTGYFVTASTFFVGIAILLVCSFVSSSIMMLLTIIAKSSTAIGVINGVAGTFFGFVCGVYMPYSNLGKGVATIGSLFPFTHLVIWFKNLVLKDAFSQTQVVGETKQLLMNDMFSAESIGFCGIDAPLWLMLLYSCVFALVCLFVSSLLLKKRIGQK